MGFQCPECVAEGRASIPAVRTRLGARVPSRPSVTIAIIALNVIAFGWEYLAGNDAVTQAWAMIPGRVALFDEYYRMFSSMFLHYGLLHIGFNMFVLWFLGPQLEQVLGHVRFAVLYLLAGIGGSVAVLMFSSPVVRAGGASGAIFGLMGAYVVVGKAMRTDISQVVGLIAINIVIGFVIPGTEWRAHLGGLVVGAAVAAVFAYAPARRRMLVQTVGLVAIVVLLVTLTTVRDQSLTQELTALGLEQVAPYLE